MSFEHLIGHERAIEALRRAMDAERLHHALLFQGPEGVGKRTLARALAAEVLARGAEDPASARARLDRRAHPDLLVVRRISRLIKKPPCPMADLSEEQEQELLADKQLSAQIRAFQIRELIQHAGYSPREASCRVFLIDPAERMNPTAQNALLKTLEEPPGATYLMLVTARPHLLLPTVRSRCYAVRLGPLPAERLAAELAGRGMPRDEAVSRASLARGRPGQALRLDPEALGERRARLVGDLETLVGSRAGLAELPAMAAALAGGTEADLLDGLEVLEEVLREAARLGYGLPGDVSLDRTLAAKLGRIGRELGPERAAALVRSVQRVRGDLRFNLNRLLAAESLLAAIAGGPVP